MTTPREIAERLLQTSERATQGQWYIEGEEVRYDYSPSTTDSGLSDCSVNICTVGRISETLDHKKFDRQHIARANPENIRAVIHAAQAMADALKGELWCRSEPGGDKCQCAGCIALKQWEGG